MTFLSLPHRRYLFPNFKSNMTSAVNRKHITKCLYSGTCSLVIVIRKAKKQPYSNGEDLRIFTFLIVKLIKLTKLTERQ